MIQLADISIFKNLIGDRIVCVGSTSLHIYDGSITIYEQNVYLELKKNSILFTYDSEFGFFENEDGDVFYDYKIETKRLENTLSRKSTVTFDTSEIIQIKIYGRSFNDKEFIAYPEIYQKIKGIKQTDDVFLFNCKNGEKIMIVFEPFLPHIEIYFKPSIIKMFWNQYSEKYKLHHTINTETSSH